jgi:hypothetical protein
MSNSPKQEEHWIKAYWRPAMCWQYFLICLFDFFLAPIFLAIFSYITKTPLQQWHPITLEGGALYHASMGAVTGVTAWSRGQEKIAVINNSNPIIPIMPGQETTTVSVDQQNIKPVRRQGEDG